MQKQNYIFGGKKMKLISSTKGLVGIFAEGIKLLKKQEKLIKNQNVLLSVLNDTIIYQQNKMNLYREKINAVKKYLPQDVLEQLESEGL